MPAPRQAAVAADIDLSSLEQEARRRIGEMAYAYYSGGAGDERLLAENVSAWSHWRLHHRVLVDVSHVSTESTVLGAPVVLPVLLAPTAVQCLAHPEGEVATARGAAEAGACLVLSSLANRSLEEVAEAGGSPRAGCRSTSSRDRSKTVEVVRPGSGGIPRIGGDGRRPGVRVATARAARRRSPSGRPRAAEPLHCEHRAIPRRRLSCGDP